MSGWVSRNLSRVRRMLVADGEKDVEVVGTFDFDLEFAAAGDVGGVGGVGVSHVGHLLDLLEGGVDVGGIDIVDTGVGIVDDDGLDQVRMELVARLPAGGDGDDGDDGAVQ